MFLLLALAGGCRTAYVERPLTQELGSNDAQTQLEFWHQLAKQPVTSNDEAFHGLLVYLDEDDPADTYDGRVRELKSRKMLPGGFHQPADRAVERGTLAVAIVRALDVKGGLVMRLLGPSPRYATRELMFMELFPTSSPGQTFSGTEFLGIIGKMEDYRRERDGGEADTPEIPEQSPAIDPEPRPGVEPETESGVRS